MTRNDLDPSRDCLATSRVDRIGDVLARGLRDVGDHDLRAFIDEASRDPFAEAGPPRVTIATCRPLVGRCVLSRA